MLSMKRLTAKILGYINSATVIREYSVTTTANSNVSPFGAYVQVNIAILTGYKITSVTIAGAGSSNPCMARPSIDGYAFVYSRQAGTFTMRVTYTKV